jgi:hypothetical protein
MRFAFIGITVWALLFLCGCAKRGTSDCAIPLHYVTNQFTSGEQAINHASEYRVSFSLGSKDSQVTAKVDTAASNLIINAKDFDYGLDTELSKNRFVLQNGSNETQAINAKDTLDMGCMADVGTRFTLAASHGDIENTLGLSYGDKAHRPHERKSPPFFDQLVKNEGIKDVFSLALCGMRGHSRLILGGVDDNMKAFIGNFVPIIEKSAYVVPAINLRLADNKKVIAEFPTYDPETKTGVRTIIDSGSAFLLLPSDMAKKLADTVKDAAFSLNLDRLFPEGFFRTERATSTKVVQLLNATQLRQFPSFEITILGSDGINNTLELSPQHYFKEIDSFNPLLRTFAVRETRGDVVLGQPFLESHYTFFDRKHGLIGFADSDVGCTP